MVLYVGKTFTAATAGAALKTVQCEKCGSEFFYELRRLGVGESTAHYLIGQDSAKQSAEDLAKATLNRQLAADEDPVPCPACKWVNETAVRQYRRLHHRGWYWMFSLSLFFCLLIDLLLYLNARQLFNREPSIWAKEIWITNLIFLPLAAGSLLLQHWLRHRFDPNRQHVNGFPKVPPGTPVAFIKNDAGELIPSPANSQRIPEEAEWAIFRPGQLVFEPVCCLCLQSPTLPFTLPMAARPILPVPLCRDCLRSVRTKFWLRNLAVIPLCILLAWLVSQIPERIDLVGRLMSTGFLGFLFGGIGFVIVDATLRPYSLGVADGAVGKIRFANPAYTALIVRNIARQDGIV